MRTPRILMIDDDVPLTQTVRINLEDTGRYEVMVENNPRNALATAREFQPDLVLLDVVMPELDGGDVSALLRSDPKLAKVPIIMVTALVSNQETGQDASIGSGGQIMVAKPIHFEKLVLVIESVLSKAQ